MKPNTPTPKHGKPGPRAKKLPRTINWKLTYTELAATHKVSVATLNAEFQRRFPDKRKHFKSKPIAVKKRWQEFASWDWNLNNGELGRLHKKTSERVRQIRELLGKPDSPRKGLRTKNVLPFGKLKSV